MEKRMITIVLCIIILLIAGCSANNPESPLNPDKPITVTVWHYYNGVAKEAFDKLVLEFNDTIGIEKGIVVDAKSQGDVKQLASAVFDSANGFIGAAPMPEIFASYADNAFRVHQMVELVSLDKYYTEEEFKAYREEFLEEGRFTTDNKYYIVPIAKSYENLYVNKNYWEPFAEKYGYSNLDLATWEGLYEVAKTYYEETSKSFFGLDAVANYMLVSNMQLGSELYSYSDDGTVSLNFKRDNAKMIWDYFYRPYINGYFSKSGRFSSDDAKTGSVLSYTGSTSGAAYFPTEVNFDGKQMVEIEPLVLPYPYFKHGSPVVIQQGAGMCITKSDEPHEYAAMVFLKWFTNPSQNLKFAISTGYFPVENEAFSETIMLDLIDKDDVSQKAVEESIKASNIMFDDFVLYNNRPFYRSFDMRDLLDINLINKINRDLEILNEKVSNGENRSELISDLCSEESFEEWYSNFTYEANLILDEK